MISGKNVSVHCNPEKIINNGNIVTCPGIINVAINNAYKALLPLNFNFAKANAANEEVNRVPNVEHTAIKI